MFNFVIYKENGLKEDYPEEFLLSEPDNSEVGWREMSPTEAQVILIASKLISQNLSPEQENMLDKNVLYRSPK